MLALQLFMNDVRYKFDITKIRKMKKITLVLAFLLANLAVLAQAKKENHSTSGPVMAFAEDRYEFGDIPEGDKVEHTFEFENSGNEPLIISNVLTTCGCTVPEWPREPIPPGGTGKIDVVFNSTNKSGVQNKVITVLSNAGEGRTKLTLYGNVKVAGTANR